MGFTGTYLLTYGLRFWVLGFKITCLLHGLVLGVLGFKRKLFRVKEKFKWC